MCLQKLIDVKILSIFVGLILLKVGYALRYISIVKELLEDTKNVKKDIEELFSKHQTAFQKLGLVKYDAFKEMGGKLSFTLALLDENNNGFLMNSVHSSDGCYSYTKRVKNGDSEIALSNEEKVAIERAMKGTASNPDAE